MGNDHVYFSKEFPHMNEPSKVFAALTKHLISKSKQALPFLGKEDILPNMLSYELNYEHMLSRVVDACYDEVYLVFDALESCDDIQLKRIINIIYRPVRVAP